MRALRAWWPVLLAAPLLVAHLLVFNFVTDDAFISFVYARNLAQHGQLVFNLGFALHLEDRRAAAVAFALAAMTRPEGNLFFALAILHRLLVFRGRRIDLASVAIYLGVYGPYFAWRWHYYGWPLPNTFYIKS